MTHGSGGGDGECCGGGPKWGGQNIVGRCLCWWSLSGCAALVVKLAGGCCRCGCRCG